MKGMTKILRGYTFKSVLHYSEGRGEKNEAPEGRLIGGNMVGRTVRELLDEFLTVRRLRPDIEKTTWHNSLRLPPGDHLDDERWRVVVGDYMQRMGFSPAHPYCIWAHDDESAVHIIASRVGFDGRVYLGQNENLASTRHIQDLERDHGLRLTKGPEYIDPDAEPEALRPIQSQRRGLSKTEIDLSVRTRKEPPKQALQRLIDEAVSDSPTVLQLVERLEAADVTVVANLASTGRLNGFSFLLDGVSLKGSQLGKAYAWAGLQARGVTYDQDRDGPSIRRFSAEARANQDSDGAAGANLRSAQADPGLVVDAGSISESTRAVERPVHRGSAPDAAPLATSAAGNAVSGQAERPRFGCVDRADRAVAGPDPSEAAAAGRTSGEVGRAPGQARSRDELAFP